jgi:hypothetical protein
MRHLYAAITANGFGHAVQSAAVVAELRRRHPGLAVTLRSSIPRAKLASVFEEPFVHLPAPHDFGVVIRSATELDLDATRTAYRRLDGGLNALIEEEGAAIAASGADLVLSNISFATVAAARRRGVPVVALATLSWGGILAGLFPGDARMQGIARHLHDCYAEADLLVRAAPSMPFEGARRMAETGPIGTRGCYRRAEIAAMIGLGADERLVVVALGGMGDAPPVASWPAMPGLRFLLPAGVPVGPAGHDLSALGLPFADILASADAFIGKPGYGSVAGAAVNGLPFLYRRRGDWPEEPWLIDWMETHARSREIAADRLEAGRIGGDLDALLDAPPRPPVEPTGAAETASLAEALVRETAG